MTTQQQTVSPLNGADRDLLSLLQVAVPVSDLALSATWYRDLLDLQYAREFGDQNSVTGCALADFDSHFLIALRRRDTTAGQADLRGEHPIIVQAADAAAADRIRQRGSALGITSTSGVHADGTWIEFLDPDGIALRVVYDTTGPQQFMGVLFTDTGVTFYEEPRLVLA